MVKRRKPSPFPEPEKLKSQFEAAEKRRHQEAHLHDMVEELPPDTVEECDVMISGLRIDRFVGEWECEGCPLSYYDHTLGFMFEYWDKAYKVFNPIKVCIKDFLKKCKELGIKYDVAGKYDKG